MAVASASAAGRVGESALRASCPAAPPKRRWNEVLASDRGAQAIEFALVLPLVALALLTVVQAGLVGAELVWAQGLAREAARVAATGGDEAEVRRFVEQAAAERDVRVQADPPAAARRPGTLVTVRLQVRSAVADRLQLLVWLPARAAMVAEPQ